MPPPTRREQLALDELLSDIYRGIETLPDKQQQQQLRSNYGSASSRKINSNPLDSNEIFSRSQVKEYELPASSPIVKQHKQDISALRNSGNQNVQYYQAASSSSGKQPQRSTLKRQTNQQTATAEPARYRHEQPQSLANFVTSNIEHSATPENRRRVRIVDHPDKLTKSSHNEYYKQDYKPSASYSGDNGGRERVKYMNTNKLIYHEEKNPYDDDYNDEEELSDTNQSDRENNSQDDEDIDGVTRVEYYHTTWLDRQLGRASKRRSSKELNERQVKEKAMIEELKSSLKNGAITLRKSLRGKKHNKNSKYQSSDDQNLNASGFASDRKKDSTVFGSGLATLPRKYHQTSTYSDDPYNSRIRNSTSATSTHYQQQSTPKQTTITKTSTITIDKNNNSSIPNQHQTSSPYANTLPHNYSQPGHRVEHQLLQSHYRQPLASKANKLTTSGLPRGTKDSNQAQLQPQTSASSYNSSNTMQFPKHNQNKSNTLNSHHTGHHYQNLVQPAEYQSATTISSLPSATEVVRSALSRSSSQTSVNQLMKTINLIPTSPSPYPPSPTTPIQQLKASSPSLSPSPVVSPSLHQMSSNTCLPSSQYTKTMPLSQDQNQPAVLRGTRIIPAPTVGTGIAPTTATQPKYPTYNATQTQPKRPYNQASIREFNELDNLLKSLSPGSRGYHTTQVTPGYSTKPTQPSFGYGFNKASPASNQQKHHISGPDQSSIYAQVHKSSQQQPGQQYQAPLQHQQNQQPIKQVGFTPSQPRGFTIDVTDEKDESCERQKLNSLEAPIEILPSMEDYQNISRLNPVKNHHWYKPNMSRERAIALLKDKPQGTFIVRDSTSFRGAYGLAVKVARLPPNVLSNASLRVPHGDPSDELIRHFLIEPAANGVRLKGYANEPVFGSLPNLIYQHSLTELALPCKLIIPRADIEDPEFNIKQKQFFDEFLASKELAKHSPYESTSPNGGYRVYPGNVYVHNEHRIIFE